MKKTLLVLSSFLLFSQVRSQLLDTALLKKFDPGVVMKVFNIAKYVKLTVPQQNYLAAYYQITDSIAKAWIAQGRPVEQIDSLQRSSSRIFYEFNQVPQNKRSEYATKNAAQYASLAALGEMEYIKEEYKPGETEINLIQKWVHNKYNFTYQRYLMNDRDEYSSRQSAALYDLYNFYPALYDNKFITDYLAKLSSIKPVPATLQEKMRLSFLNVTKENKYSDWSKNLLEITRLFLPDTTYFSSLYKGELTTEAAVLCTTDKYNLINIQHVSYNAYDSIFYLVFTKNYKNALLQYTYGAHYAHVADSLVQQNSKYYDSSIKASLIRDGSLQPATQFAIGLKYKEYLQLSRQVVDSMVYHAMYLSGQQDSIHLRDPFASVSSEAYESAHLSKLLTEQQYTSLLMLKNKPNAFADAKRDWADMQKRNLTQGLDNEQTIIQMANYYIARYSAWNRMAHDTGKQIANMKALEEIKPQPLKILDAAKWNAEPEKTGNSLKVQW